MGIPPNSDPGIEFRLPCRKSDRDRRSDSESGVGFQKSGNHWHTETGWAPRLLVKPSPQCYSGISSKEPEPLGVLRATLAGKRNAGHDATGCKQQEGDTSGERHVRAGVRQLAARVRANTVVVSVSGLIAFQGAAGV